jgi:hypothetical protein
LPENHAHLLELSSRRLACACSACGLLFSGQLGARYKRIPRRREYLEDFHLSDVAWSGLSLPVDLAFFVHSSQAGRVVALYPSPGGATEAQTSPESWEQLVQDNPVLTQFEPDVEALLVNRVGDARDCYRVGIDVCYRLVGLMRTHWQGFSGGPAVWGAIASFFAGLREDTAHA